MLAAELLLHPLALVNSAKNTENERRIPKITNVPHVEMKTT